MILRQSTAVTIALGPFLDSTDGNTAETALTISQADVRLKKNDGAWAQKGDATAATHEENGWYEVPLDATDTATVGILKVAVHESGALPVWETFQIVEEAVYDALYAASAVGPLAANDTGDGLTAIPWNAAWDAEVQSEAADALTAYDPPTNAEMVARTLAAASYATATGVADLPTNAELATALGTADDAVLAAIAALNNLSQANIRTALGLATANLDTQLGDLPTNAELAARTLLAAAYATAANQTSMDGKLDTIDGVADAILVDTGTTLPATLATIAAFIDTEVAAILTDTGTTIPALIAALNNLDAAGVRTAIGLATANLDTQLGDVPTNAELAARTLLAAAYATVTNQTAIEADTQDIQSRLPASLNNGAMPADIQRLNDVEFLGTGAVGDEFTV